MLDYSRSTVLRRLQEHHYYSSYNFAGKFLSIEEVVAFDANGLWAWKGARFSKYGTLKSTVEHFVRTSERGMTHQELSELLAVRVHNVLLDLVKTEKIRREQLGPTLVYLSPRQSDRSRQILRRESLLENLRKNAPTSRHIIATLLEVIKDREVQRADVAARCKREGVAITREIVDAIFEKYDLDKKRAL